MTNFRINAVAVVAVSLSLILAGCSKEQHGMDENLNQRSSPQTITGPGQLNGPEDAPGNQPTEDPCDMKCLVNAPEELTLEEEEMLIFMQEEEKMAHDVYYTLALTYPQHVFDKIAESEETHMAKVTCLLDHYLVEYNLLGVGSFKNQDIQDLYDGLILRGEELLLEALKVGAEIEDLDIVDLWEYITETENSAIISVFENLACGSCNHLRTFNEMLEARGFNFVPLELSQEEFDIIIAEEHQFCGEE